MNGQLWEGQPGGLEGEGAEQGEDIEPGEAADLSGRGEEVSSFEQVDALTSLIPVPPTVSSFSAGPLFVGRRIRFALQLYRRAPC